jgi:stage II sporulation SpoD-like protein
MVRRVRLLAVLLVAGCAGEPLGEIGESSHALEAFCEAEVSGSGVLDVENDYIPQVVACENGGASLEALKAQAVAARTYLYYKLRREGAIGDGQGDQVYTCNATAGGPHRRAAAETSGQVLMYGGVVIASFYVAGALQSGPDCVGGTSDPTGTEHFVTYNQGRSGGEVEQTTLGWVDPANKENRGCQSQNGAHCLSDEGWDYDSILRF